MHFAAKLVVEPTKEELVGEGVDEGDVDDGVVGAVGS